MRKLIVLTLVLLVATAGVAFALGNPSIVRLGIVPIVWQTQPTGDFNDDGRDDVLWRHATSGELYLWLMTGTTFSASSLGVVELAWKIVGTGDFDADGKTDIVWRNSSTGANYVWFMNGASVASTEPLDTVADQAWKVIGTGDFNGDGKADLLWRHDTSGEVFAWYTDAGVVAPDPVIAAVGDICSTPTDCAPSAAAVASMDADNLLLLGDNAYNNGSTSDYASFYHPNYGQFNSIVKPAPGNHEYQTAGAAGYFGYFSGVAPYYSFDLGAWHLISLNSEIPVSDGSTQENWLEADLAAVPAGKCILAYWHQPRWSSGQHNSNSTYGQLWVDLYAAGADIVLNGHDHNYERFAKQNASGVAAANGIREFVVGTGGRPLRAFGATAANSEVRNNTSFGALKITLKTGGYDWQFVPVTGHTLNDSGSDTC